MTRTQRVVLLIGVILLGVAQAARKTITYAQYSYEEGPIGLELAKALAERCRAGVRAHVLLDGFGTLRIPWSCSPPSASARATTGIIAVFSSSMAASDSPGESA